MASQFVVVMDGPAAAGKSSIAAAAARRTGLITLGSGLVHRANTAYMLGQNIPCRPGEELTAHLESVRVDLTDTPDGLRVCINGEDMTSALYSPAVGQWVSRYAHIPAVAAAMTRVIRTWVKGRRVLVEGRGLANSILPGADLKIYVDCDIAVRAGRWAEEQRWHGRAITIGEAMAHLAERDRLDMCRELNPLVRLPEAVYIDTTRLSVDEATDLVCAALQTHGHGR